MERQRIVDENLHLVDPEVGAPALGAVARDAHPDLVEQDHHGERLQLGSQIDQGEVHERAREVDVGLVVEEVARTVGVAVEHRAEVLAGVSHRAFEVAKLFHEVGEGRYVSLVARVEPPLVGTLTREVEGVSLLGGKAVGHLLHELLHEGDLCGHGTRLLVGVGRGIVGANVERVHVVGGGLGDLHDLPAQRLDACDILALGVQDNLVHVGLAQLDLELPALRIDGLACPGLAQDERVGVLAKSAVVDQKRVRVGVHTEQKPTFVHKLRADEGHQAGERLGHEVVAVGHEVLAQRQCGGIALLADGGPGLVAWLLMALEDRLDVARGVFQLGLVLGHEHHDEGDREHPLTVLHQLLAHLLGALLGLHHAPWHVALIDEVAALGARLADAIVDVLV